MGNMGYVEYNEYEVIEMEKTSDEIDVVKRSRLREGRQFTTSSALLASLQCLSLKKVTPAL